MSPIVSPVASDFLKCIDGLLCFADWAFGEGEAPSEPDGDAARREARTPEPRPREISVSQRESETLLLWLTPASESRGVDAIFVRRSQQQDFAIAAAQDHVEMDEDVAAEDAQVARLSVREGGELAS